MKRNLILEIPYEQRNDEFYCTLTREDVLLPLKEFDVIEASLGFQAYDNNGIGHQDIYVSDVEKL